MASLYQPVVPCAYFCWGKLPSPHTHIPWYPHLWRTVEKFWMWRSQATCSGLTLFSRMCLECCACRVYLLCATCHTTGFQKLLWGLFTPVIALDLWTCALFGPLGLTSELGVRFSPSLQPLTLDLSSGLWVSTSSPRSFLRPVFAVWRQSLFISVSQMVISTRTNWETGEMHVPAWFPP